MAAPHPSRDEALIELADRTVHVARKLNARMLQDPQIVPLTPLEAHVVRHLELRTSNASTVLRTLVEKSLLRRESSPDDRRVVRYTLTETAVDSVERLHAQWVADVGAALPDALDPTAALEVLRTLEDAL
jgi:hypothetical protein